MIGGFRTGLGMAGLLEGLWTLWSRADVHTCAQEIAKDPSCQVQHGKVPVAARIGKRTLLGWRLLSMSMSRHRPPQAAFVRGMGWMSQCRIMQKPKITAFAADRAGLDYDFSLHTSCAWSHPPGCSSVKAFRAGRYHT